MTIPSPNDTLTCLLVQPKFSVRNFWSFAESARAIGAKATAPPLGLLTVAALLPQHWSFRLVDLNVRDLTDVDWEEADIVCVGGMLSQQAGILDVIAEAKERGKYVAVGGADPTSQPDVYCEADARVLGEGEFSIPLWIESWRAGRPRGTFEAGGWPDLTQSPVPRFDLIDFNDYIEVGVQFSRGCPFHCEFCDIIELYGRTPRVKTTDQFLRELKFIYELGYRGWVEIVDDNFIGNKRQVKPMLRELEKWSREKRYPFFFSTEASMNLADDLELLDLMRQVDFRFVFMGIETPDPDLLALTQKQVNTMKPIAERVQRVHDHGISVMGGFIIGFDGEKQGMDTAMIDCIDQTGILIAMVGLLVALPNTQLSKRLQRENRLLSPDHQEVADAEKPHVVLNHLSVDQMTGGLNFVTSRDRVEILTEYRNVIETIYDATVFMDRVLATAKRMKIQRRHLPNWWEWKRTLRGLWSTAKWMSANREIRWYYWRNFLRSFAMGFGPFEFAQTMAAIYIHFDSQSRYLQGELTNQINSSMQYAIHERMVDEPSKTAA